MQQTYLIVIVNAAGVEIARVPCINKAQCVLAGNNINSQAGPLALKATGYEFTYKSTDRTADTLTLLLSAQQLY